MRRHRPVDGTVTAPAPNPTRDELVAAIDPSTRIPDLAQRFGISPQRIRRLMDDYGIPRFPAGQRPAAWRAAKTSDTDERAVYGPPRPRTPLDDLCDQLAADYQRRAAFKLKVLLQRINEPAPEPIGATLGDKWRDRALCVGLDPGIFMPPRGPLADPNAQPELAERACAVCPVRDVCPFSLPRPARDYSRALRRRTAA